VNWRAVGCGALAASAFILFGIVSLFRAFAPAECPPSLPYQPAAYQPVGSPVPTPGLEGVPDRLELAGTTSFGFASWEVWVEPGRAPSASGEPLPQRIVLDCRDGTFQPYQRGTGESP
jgi:hypothetical protein